MPGLVSAQDIDDGVGAVPGVEVGDEDSGLLGVLSAWISYSTQDGVKGGADGRFKLSAAEGQWLTAGAEISKNSQQVKAGYVVEEAFGAGTTFELGVQGFHLGSTQNILFETRSASLQLANKWDLGNGASVRAHIGYASNEIYNPGAGLSAIITPDVGQTRKVSLGAQYGRAISYDTGKLSKLRYDVGVEVGSISSGETQLKSTASLKMGGFLSDAVVWRTDVRFGALSTSGGASSIGDRFILGGHSIRGFSYGGFGPRDGNQTLGGNKYAVARFDLLFPQAFGGRGIFIPGLHADVGSLWELDNTNGGAVDDAAHVRSSVGATISAQLKQGLLSLSLSHVLKKQPTDDPVSLQLGFVSRF